MLQFWEVANRAINTGPLMRMKDFDMKNFKGCRTRSKLGMGSKRGGSSKEGLRIQESPLSSVVWWRTVRKKEGISFNSTRALPRKGSSMAFITDPPAPVLKGRVGPLPPRWIAMPQEAPCHG